MSWSRIAGFRIVTADIERLARFYAAIGFEIGERRPIGDDDMRMLGLGGRGERMAMTLGDARIDLERYERPGRAYPDRVAASSALFQHLAIVTGDAAAAWVRAVAAGASAIGASAPVTLPASSGGVTAIKLRDPDGHPLEFLQFPDAGLRGWTGRGMLGIDHSAIAVSNVRASMRFYEDHGLSPGDATVNEGRAQAALDGLDDPLVDVVPMRPVSATPHLELLGYRRPPAERTAPPAPNDIAATRIVWRAGATMLLRDLDGHIHELRGDPGA